MKSPLSTSVPAIVLLLMAIASCAKAQFFITTPNAAYAYTVAGYNSVNPTITLIAGNTYTIAVNTSDIHPVCIQTNTVLDGPLYSGATPVTCFYQGMFTLTLPAAGYPLSLYFVCEYHGFYGTFTIVPPAPQLTITTPNDVFAYTVSGFAQPNPAVPLMFGSSYAIIVNTSSIHPVCIETMAPHGQPYGRNLFAGANPPTCFYSGTFSLVIPPTASDPTLNGTTTLYFVCEYHGFFGTFVLSAANVTSSTGEAEPLKDDFAIWMSVLWLVAGVAIAVMLVLGWRSQRAGTGASTGGWEHAQKAGSSTGYSSLGEDHKRAPDAAVAAPGGAPHPVAAPASDPQQSMRMSINSDKKTT